MLLNERPKRFRIIARLSVLSPKQQLEELSDESSAPSEMLPWCLIFEDSSAGGTSSRSPVRWIEESQVQQWRKEGSSVVGSIPQPLQETWEYSLSSLRSELDQQRDDLTSRLDEVNAAYQAYKIRAQSALKRIGNEERNEKQRAHEQEVPLINIHTYIHTHTHTHIHTYTHIHTQTHTNTLSLSHTHTHTYIHTLTHTQNKK